MQVSEIYGKSKWADLFTLEHRWEKVLFEFWDGGERKQHERHRELVVYLYG